MSILSCLKKQSEVHVEVGKYLISLSTKTDRTRDRYHMFYTNIRSVGVEKPDILITFHGEIDNNIIDYSLIAKTRYGAKDRLKRRLLRWKKLIDETLDELA